MNLIFSGKGATTGERRPVPVNLLDIYPTLIDLTDLPEYEGVDGVSLKEILHDPEAYREAPALTTHGFKNHTLRGLY